MTGAVTLLALAAVAAAVVLTVTPSHGSPVASAAGTPAAVSSPAAAAVVPVITPSPRTSAHSLRKVSSPASSAAAPVAQYTAQATQPSPYPSASPRSDSASGSFAAQASGRLAHGGYWPGRWNGAGVPRFTGIRGNLTGFSGFTGGLRHLGPGNRPLFPEAFLLILLLCFVS
jgi:hypothetical protein